MNNTTQKVKLSSVFHFVLRYINFGATIKALPAPLGAYARKGVIAAHKAIKAHDVNTVEYVAAAKAVVAKVMTVVTQIAHVAASIITAVKGLRGTFGLLRALF